MPANLGLENVEGLQMPREEFVESIEKIYVIDRVILLCSSRPLAIAPETV